MRRTAATFLALVMVCGLNAASIARAEDCDKAEEISRQAFDLGEGSRAKALLQRALRLCPNSAVALNNLGVIQEREGKLGKAEKLYRAALKANPGFREPLAGLGDVAFKRGNFKQAAVYYRRFLEQAPQSGGYFNNEPGPGQNLAIYRARLKAAETKAGIHSQSMRGVVGREYLVRGMTTRSVQGIRQRIALNILFAYDSAEITGQSRKQLEEMARAMDSPEMASHTFLIIGHTDSFGPEDYNLQLSRRRAQAVKNCLASLGIDIQRLKTEGAGESRLLVPGGSREEQAENRRVEFVVY